MRSRRWVMVSSNSSAFNEDKEVKNAKQGVQAYETERTYFVQALIQAIPANTQDPALLNLIAQLKQEEKTATMGLREIYDLAKNAVREATDQVAAQSLQNALLHYGKTKAINNDHNYFVRCMFLAEMECKQYVEQQANQLKQEIKNQQKIINDEIAKLERACNALEAHIDKLTGSEKTKELKKQELAKIKEGIKILTGQKEALAKLDVSPTVQRMQLVALEKRSIEAFISHDKRIIQQYSQIINTEKIQSFWSKVFGWKTQSDRAQEQLRPLLNEVLDGLSKSPPSSLSEAKLSAAISYLESARPRDEAKKTAEALRNIQKKMVTFQEESKQLEASEKQPSPKLADQMAEVKKISGEREVNGKLEKIKNESKKIQDDAKKITGIVLGINKRVSKAETHLEVKRGDVIHSACVKKQEILQPEKKLTIRTLKFLNNSICVSKGQGKDKDKLSNIFHEKTRGSANTAAKFAYHRLKKAWTVSGNPSGDPITSLKIQRRAAAAASFLAYAIAKDRKDSKLDERERNNIKTALFIYGQLISTNKSLDKIMEEAAKQPYASTQVKGIRKPGSPFQKILDEFSAPDVVGEVDFVERSLDQSKEIDSVPAKEYQALLDFHNNPEGNLINFAEAKTPKLLESPSHLLAVPFKEKIFPSKIPPVEIKNQKALHKIYTDQVQNQKLLVDRVAAEFKKLNKNAFAVQEVQDVEKNLLGILKESSEVSEQYSAQIAVRANLAALFYATARELNEKLEQTQDPNEIEKIKNQIKYLFQLYEKLVLTGDSISKVIKDSQDALKACRLPYEEPFNSTYELLRTVTQSSDMQALLHASEVGGLVNEANVDALCRYHETGMTKSFAHEAAEKNMDNLNKGLNQQLNEARVEEREKMKQKTREEEEARREKTQRGKTPEERKGIQDAAVEQKLTKLEVSVKELEEKVAEVAKANGLDETAVSQKKEIEESVVLSEYYYTFIRKLTAELMAAKTIYSGKVADTHLTAAQQAMKPVQLVGGIFSPFGGDIAANALTAATNLYEERQKAIANTYLARSFTTMGEAEKFVEELARRLTLEQKYHLEEVKALTSTDIMGQASDYVSNLRGNESLSAIEQYASSQVESFLTAITDGHLGELGLELADSARREEALDRAVKLTTGDSVYVEIEEARHPHDQEVRAALVDLETQLVAAAEATEEERRSLEEVLGAEVEKPKQTSSTTKTDATPAASSSATPSSKGVELDKKQGSTKQEEKTPEAPVLPVEEPSSSGSRMRR